MSGFVAVFDRGEMGISREDLTPMLDSIDHRGPNGSGTWYDDDVALGHQQLQTTPQSRFDDQPYRDDDIVFVGDARLDNRSDLIDALDIRTDRTRLPDSQIIAESYRQWGEHCPDRLIGAFAFVIWDTDAEQLFCARDRFGVKPLYIHQSSDLFIAASEMKAILTAASVSSDLDELKIAGFLTKTHDDPTATFFRDIERLSPAHSLTVTAGTSRDRQYWRLDPTRTIRLDSDAAYERRFRELFEQSVRCRLRANGAVGTDLSGGLDSSSVTVVARDQLPATEELHTFSNVYPDSPTADEREFIEAVTDANGITPHYVDADGVGALADTDDLINYLDHPPHNDMTFANWERTKKSHQNDVSVVLGGELGDQTIGYGLGYLPQLFLTGRWWKLYYEIKQMSDILDVSSVRMFKRHVLANVVPDRIQRTRQRLKGNPVLLDLANPMLNPEFVDRLNLREWYNERHTELGVVWNDRRDHYKALTTNRISVSFEERDPINAAFGIEHRYPFTDKRLVEFCLAIPPDQKFANGWTRSIVRRSLDGLLPNEIQWRPWKSQMNAAAQNALLLENQRFKELFDRPGRLANYFDIDTVHRQYKQFQRDPENVDLRTPRVLWLALSLWAWLDRNKRQFTNGHRV